MDRTLDAQTLEIRQRRLAEDIVHATRERSLAGADGLRGLVERKAARQPASRSPLEALMAQAPNLLAAPPSIEPLDVLGAKGA